MPDYVKLAATTERLIQGSGRIVTVIQLEDGEDDAAEPWKGKAVPRDAATEVPVTGTFVSHKSLTELGFISEHELANMSMSRAKNKVVLISAKEAGSNLLDEFHEVQDGVERYRIDVAHVLQPGDTRLLYAMELRR